MSKKTNKSLFQRLSTLFKSGPLIKKKIRTIDTAIAVADRTKSSGALLFQKSLAPTYATITANAYNLSERLMRYQDFQEMEYCLHQDTQIAVPGGYKTLGELAAECDANENHTFIVYAYDHNLSRIVPAIGKQARQTRIDHAYTVTFDNGKQIIGTPNHRLMKRDGTFCKIEDLKSGDAMMPFYRRDLFNGCKEEGEGYRWIYSMDKRSNMNGWVSEHRIIGEMLKGSELDKDEVVHHVNFIKYDNRPENLRVMKDSEHQSLHTKIINGVKWSEENSGWIEKFKINHSKFMSENNPAERKDITFGRILEISERVNFNSMKLCEVLDTDPNVIKRRLRKNGYQDFQTFAKAYNPDWKNAGWDNRGEKNPRYDHSVTFDKICSAFSKGMDEQELVHTLGTTSTIMLNRLYSNGYSTYSEFSQNYENLKVVSVEYHGIIPLFDLTVDGYKNFATDTVVSHNTPEIAAALDIYADEACSQDDKGRVLHIYSDNEKIKEILEDLFYNTLNTEFNLRSWARNLVKYGDFFLYNDVHPDYGVVSAFPVPVNEIEREENYDRDDPFAVRFRWVTLGNRVLENWEITHFRLLGNDMFLPYGSSVIEPARRIWRQLILIEDAMLVYRVVRAPERRVFYIDVANIPASDIPTYVEEQRKNLRSNQVIDRNSGRVDLRYNPMSVDEDYFIPVRGTETGTRIETLAGGQNTAAVEDVAYIQKKLFAALKIPRAYLGYDEMLSSKATLAQEDIRFSRTINVIQRVLLAELNKLAIIHLYAHGFDGDDLQNFTLRLSNPSSVAQQQKLELWRAKFEIAGSAPEGYVNKNFIRKEIWGLNENECNEIDDARKKDKVIDAAVESAGTGGEGGDDLGGGGDDLFGGGDDLGGGGDEPPAENAGDEPREEDEPDVELLTSGDDYDDFTGAQFSIKELDSPVKIKSNLRETSLNEKRKRLVSQNLVARNKRNSKRRKHSQTHTPDFTEMLSANNRSFKDVTGLKSLSDSITTVEAKQQESFVKTNLPHDLLSALNKWKQKHGLKSNLLKESDESLFIIDEDNEI
jgi:hypothetical protein